MYDILYLVMGFVILAMIVSRTSLHIAVKIIASVAFAIIAMNHFGLLAFMNPSLNHVFSGEPITGCSFDNDCAIRQTTCSSCSCGTAVNKIWQQTCPLNNVGIPNCTICIAMKATCIDNQCVAITA